jgi:hypothetical protein
MTRLCREFTSPLLEVGATVSGSWQTGNPRVSPQLNLSRPRLVLSSALPRGTGHDRFRACELDPGGLTGFSLLSAKRRARAAERGFLIDDQPAGTVLGRSISKTTHVFGWRP